MLLWSRSGYEWIYEEIYGVDFFTSTQALEEQGLGDRRCPVKSGTMTYLPVSRYLLLLWLAICLFF